jgi:enoyl-CoA hydratase/carnithine racemase
VVVAAAKSSGEKPMAEGVRVETEGGVVVITIDRPHARNAIGLATIGELEAVLAELERSQAAVVVLTGAGDRAFISGGDLRELEKVRTLKKAEAMALRMRAVLDRLIGLPMPVIAALNGHALGGGAEVAVAADIRIAADDITIGFTQSVLGIMPAWGGAERLTDLVGRSRALMLLCGGEAVPAAEALSIGLVDRVVPRPEFESATGQLAARIAALPPGASRSIKQVVASISSGVHPAVASRSTRAFAELWVAPAHWELAAEAELRRRSRAAKPS